MVQMWVFIWVRSYKHMMNFYPLRFSHTERHLVSYLKVNDLYEMSFPPILSIITITDHVSYYFVMFMDEFETLWISLSYLRKSELTSSVACWDIMETIRWENFLPCIPIKPSAFPTSSTAPWRLSWVNEARKFEEKVLENRREKENLFFKRSVIQKIFKKDIS